jgi:hypothetical protein
MSPIPNFLFLYFLGWSLFGAIPTPDSAMTFHIEKDSRKWVIQYEDGNKKGFITDFVTEADSIKTWKEMAAHQIVFTKESLREYVDTWKKMLLKADGNVTVQEEAAAGDSILVTYTSTAWDESSMRRFIKGKDGVYMLAYHVRPKLKNEETFKIWEEIVRGAELIPNPEKKRN